VVCDEWVECEVCTKTIDTTYKALLYGEFFFNWHNGANTYNKQYLYYSILMKNEISVSQIKRTLQKNAQKPIAEQAEALYAVFQMDKFLLGLSMSKSSYEIDRIRRTKNINAKDTSGKTVLCSLVYWWDFKLYSMAIQLGADPHTLRRDGKNLMYDASISHSCNKDIIESLVYDYGLDPNDAWDSIPLFNAIACWSFDMFQVRLRVWADPHMLDGRWESIVFYALLCHKTKIILYILKKYPDLLFEPNKDNELPIEMLKRGCSKTVRKAMNIAYDKEIQRRELQ